MASIDNALTTLARLKAYLGITTNTKDTLLTRLILGSSAFVETYTNRKYKRTAYTNQLLNGSGRNKLILKHYPLVSGQTITLELNNSRLNEAEYWQEQSSEDYYIDYNAGILTHAASGFIEGYQNYRASYTAGYYLPSSANYQDGTDDDLDLPYDLETAVWDICTGIYNRRKSAGKTSESVYQVSVEYAKELKENPYLAETLNRYRRIVVR